MASRTGGLIARVRRWGGGFLPGATERRRQTADYATAWATDNTAALQGAGPLWVVLGDSTAQGIGTSSRDHSYVLVVLEALREQRDPTWRVVNLSRSGARVRDVIKEQLPHLEATSADLVSCAAGANDLVPTSQRRLERDMRELASRLPAGSLFANLPQGLAHRRALRINALITELVAEHDLVLVDLWSHTGPPWTGKFSGDHFHPNDVGYAGWADAFLEALGLEPPIRDESSDN
jgi:lysophospholipase L1-like esterase